MVERVVVFARYPEPGFAKTRLIPVLGREGAAELHRKMTERTLSRVRSLARIRGVSLEVRYVGGDRTKMMGWLGSDLTFRRQRGANLGSRMAGAFRQAFKDGAKRVVIIGTDCPAITTRLLKDALDSLYRHELVVGPAVDGGYYLIGLRRVIPDLFQAVKWGTNEVLAETMRRAAKFGVTAAVLPTEGDVDCPEDLYLWDERKPGESEDGQL
jgi:uncharacterized protein